MADDCRLPEREFRQTFPADPMLVRSALRAAVARYMRRMTSEEAGTMELVLAEVLNNIVEHAYAGRKGGMIDLSISVTGRGLEVRVADQGLPMPGGVLPAGLAPSLKMSGGTQDLPEGGFGWFLIHDLTQDIDYLRDGRTNRLRFVLPLRREGAVMPESCPIASALGSD
ncbi:ATP-binding protein [Ostreiculturibacter nitratireducens]|uniref:ATP-binding protein n=1 Tax=Ostreiculturibacter nitratireducens TaxID=3075226 RepID=UPI0031B6312A